MSQRLPTVRLREVLRRVRDEVLVQDDETYGRLTIRMNGKGIALRDRVPGFKIGTKRQFRARAGHLLLSKIDARNGAFGVLPPECDGAIITGNFWAFQVSEKIVDAKYLEYLTKTSLFVDFCIRASEGTTNRRYLQEPKFLAQEIRLPPLAEQRRLVGRIDAIAAKVEEARRLRREVDEEAAALWERAAAEVCDRAIENSVAQRLADIVEVRGGGTPSKSNPFFWGGRIPWVSPKDMKQREIRDSIDHISEEATRETAAKLVDPGAVLIVVRGMILVHTVPSAVLRVPAAINQDMKALIPGPEVLPEYLSALFWAYNQRLVRLVEKSTHDTRKLQTTKLLDSKIPVPPIEQQRQIINDLLTLEVAIRELREHQLSSEIAVDAVMPAVLDRVFAGDLQDW